MKDSDTVAATVTQTPYVSRGRPHDGPPPHPSYVDLKEIEKNKELVRAKDSLFHHPV